ncbi:putative polyketide synthase protein [Neofusicoccum parvum UCRNP2]|uniref:Putative polyketide synthase protein n=1 Tax=Botryosphaeria parva (strain UCR-NP2) TaxID=1287680 RepID=R1GRD1_BOTPV|nr:putative polyketide synthase protein [Neofusicoccum parvum UCRNP2]
MSVQAEAGPHPASKQYVQEPVAVVGMACRLPGDSNSPRALWEFLQKGGVAGTEPPSTRFSLKGHHDSSDKPTTLRNPGGMFLEGVDPADFDAGFFNISRTDAVSMDPQQRQLLEVVYEGLENAGIPIETLSGAPYGCFVGSYESDYAWMHARDPQNRPPSCAIGVGRSILSNRISHFLNIKGPSLTLDTACSGSLVGVDVACRYLQTGEISGAIVAGANLYLNPDHSIENGALRNAHSASGRCHTFDSKADGYIKAEAINAVVLKRLADAVRDGDPIRAVIRGTANNHNGRTPGIASPSSEDQAAAIRAAYRNAAITDYSLTSYLECHGTGTNAGDPIEVKGIASVFAESRAADKPLVVGSVKSNIGHSEPAAGISGLLKAILTIEQGIIPGNPTFERPNPAIDFEALRVRPTRTAIPFPRAPFRRASVNSFGFGGSNCHAILDEPKALIKDFAPAHTSSFKSTEDDEDDFFSDDEAASRPYVLLFSANDESSLKAYTKEMSKHLSNLAVKADLRDLAYTLSERRSHHFNRGYVIARKSELDENAIVLGKKEASTPKIGFVFTGQGAQWPRMGKEVFETFPGTAQVVKELDTVLRSLPTPPDWSLYEELTAPRSSEHLRQPEFSQPLVTALQLALLSVLSGWGIRPQSVVGHSSGEIAAAYAAGFLTQADAIVVAYHRGLAAKHRQHDGEASLGMLAVGIGKADIGPYLDGLESVHIACYNSPKSLTLSGVVSNLEQVRARLTQDGHFARMLQVNLAYHSTFMDEIGKEYESLLLRDFHGQSCKPGPFGDVTMFSSVYGHALAEDQTTDVGYWKSNMVSPVRFDDAFREMTAGKDGANFVIEIGPSGALAGPIGQIKDSLESGSAIQYCTALKRGAESVGATLDVAGKLFLKGVPVRMDRVNADEEHGRPLVITDLPNYSWNHSTKYWYECSESKEWRYKQFPSHDLLGSKVLGTPWRSPSFKRILKLAEVPWLRDHCVGSDIVMPAAGFVAMAVEAMFQTYCSLRPDGGVRSVEELCYRLRNIKFDKALVVEEDVPAEYMLTLNPLAGTKDSWHEFKVSSNKEGVMMDHVGGLILATTEEIAPLKHTSPGHLWYKISSEVGYAFGPAFQKQVLVEAVAGQRNSRSHISFTEPPSAYTPQSPYSIHPAVLDGCFQSATPSIWAGGRSTMNAVLIPAIIDDLVINPVSAQQRPELGVAVARAEYSGRGRPEIAKNYKSSCAVYHPQTGALLVQMTNLSCHQLDVGADLFSKHTFMQSVFTPDLSRIRTQEQAQGLSCTGVQDVLDIAAHKKPALAVLEINVAVGDASCLWFEGRERANRLTYSKYAFMASDARDLVSVQNESSSERSAAFSLLDATKSDLGTGAADFDFVIIKTRPALVEATAQVLRAASSVLADAGRVLVVEQVEQTLSRSSDIVIVEKEDIGAESRLQTTIFDSGFGSAVRLSCGDQVRAVYLCAPASETAAVNEPQELYVVHLTSTSRLGEGLRAALASTGWRIKEQACPSVDVPAKSAVLILDELYSSVLSTVTPAQWQIIKDITTRGCRLLWVTQGAHLHIASPERAMANGLFRTICAEDPSAHCTTLDVEQAEGAATSSAIVDILSTLRKPRPKTAVEAEFFQRDGVLHVNRILPDAAVNAAKAGAAAEPVPQRLHDAQSIVRMRAERIGTFDALQYSAITPAEQPVAPGCVEIELFAAGLNYKDLVVTMGVVPENEHLLGLEGAGLVRRVGAGVKGFSVGDRVATIEKGLLANRIQAPVKRVVPIPEAMTYEEAATMPVVFATSVYSIFDIGALKKGQSILIHSAAGGVGIACIQLAKYIGAEIYVTVGSEAKRQFLQEKFGIPPARMFSSRDPSFGPAILEATGGKGIDLIINSLTGDLLDASWRICADGGTMVEIGKRDIVERNFLSMEPFDRNCSFRAVDISYSKHITDDVLLTKVFDLVKKGAIGPIQPITTFSFSQIPEAFAYMRSGRHVGKIVISDGPSGNVEVPVRPFAHDARLRGDVAYLIVGGLKGLCGSLAIHMARRGAKHIVSMSRSGCSDGRSQAVVVNCNSLGCKVYEAKGDVGNPEDVHTAFAVAPVPIGGVIQGSMVLRDKPYEDMSVQEYHDCIACKVSGTWNLHKASLSLPAPLSFFTLLSSVSGVVGNKGQANYAAANTFLDSFAAYRHSLGLAANSVNLGVIQDVGYVAEQGGMETHLGSSQWTGIAENALHVVLDTSIAQQQHAINPASVSQLVTGIALPQSPADSDLTRDARFAGLFLPSNSSGGSSGKNTADAAVQAFLALHASGASPDTVLPVVLDVINAQLTKTLRLSEALEPGKPLSVYGLDSLSAVEIRNWIRMELGAEITTLEIIGAASLVALAEKVVAKLPVVSGNE